MDLKSIKQKRHSHCLEQSWEIGQNVKSLETNINIHKGNTSPLRGAIKSNVHTNNRGKT